jgi:pimeloyl-ACP methyl ester esterase
MTPLHREPGVRLHLEATGQGPPLLLVHGWSRSSADLAPLAARLAARHRVISLDLRGHGRSTPGEVSRETLAGDLVALVEALAPERPVLLGWSLGGQAALEAAPRLAGRLRGLVLVATTPRFTAGEGWTHGQPARAVEGLARLLARQPERTLARFLDDCFAPGELDEAARARVAGLGTPPPDPACARAGLDLLATTDLRAGLGAVATPALLLHGEADAICPIGAGRALAAALPRARLRAWPGCGHAPFLSRVDEVAEAVAGFAEALP